MADPTSTATGTTAGTMAGMSEDDLKNLMAMLQGGQKGGAGAYNTANLSALTEKPMGLDPYMTAAGIGGAAIPFVQALRLGREVNKYKPTNLVPRQAYDVVQNLSQQVNAPATNYGQRLQEINAARAARMAQARKGGTASNYLRALFGSEEMFNKASRDLGAQGAAEKVQRMAAYNQALGNLGAQEAASAERNRQTLAALKQARDLNYQKSAEGLINNLLNSVVLKNPKTPNDTQNQEALNKIKFNPDDYPVDPMFGMPSSTQVPPPVVKGVDIGLGPQLNMAGDIGYDPYTRNINLNREPSLLAPQEAQSEKTNNLLPYFPPVMSPALMRIPKMSWEENELPIFPVSPYDVAPFGTPSGIEYPSNIKMKNPRGF